MWLKKTNNFHRWLFNGSSNRLDNKLWSFGTLILLSDASETLDNNLWLIINTAKQKGRDKILRFYTTLLWIILNRLRFSTKCLIYLCKDTKKSDIKWLTLICPSRAFLYRPLVSLCSHTSNGVSMKTSKKGRSESVWILRANSLSCKKVCVSSNRRTVVYSKNV